MKGKQRDTESFTNQYSPCSSKFLLVDFTQMLNVERLNRWSQLAIRYPSPVPFCYERQNYWWIDNHLVDTTKVACTFGESLELSDKYDSR